MLADRGSAVARLAGSVQGMSVVVELRKKEIVPMAKTLLALMLTVIVTIGLAAARLQVATPNLVGDWQGILSAGQGIRVVLKIATMDATGGKATLYLIDQSPDGVPTASVTQQQTRIVCVIPAVG